jgi:hypothetical protein
MATVKKKQPKKAKAKSTQWKEELLELLDKHTDVPLVEQLKSKVITEDVLLFLNLGISPERVQALTKRFNLLIKKLSTQTPGPTFVTVDDLAECETLADLTKLIGSRM